MGHFQKMYAFQVRNKKKSTLILIIKSAVNMRTQNQANVSLISVLLVMSHQNDMVV